MTDSRPRITCVILVFEAEIVLPKFFTSLATF